MTKIAEELLALQEANNGLLQVDKVIAWAKKHKDSDLHRDLDWDDKKAGIEWRRQQVRRLIAIHIVNVEHVRQVVSLSIDRTRPGGGYRHIDAVLPVQELRVIMVNDALAELNRIRQRYQSVSELARVWDEIDKAQQKRRKTG